MIHHKAWRIIDIHPRLKCRGFLYLDYIKEISCELLVVAARVSL
ncbi:MAG: hypothetical protein PHV59_11340 [Victivallales bacterium]|nr:hypothetical protein [Victivallales bacterium]